MRVTAPFEKKCGVGRDAGSRHGDEFRTRVHWADGVDFQTDFHFFGYFTASNAGQMYTKTAIKSLSFVQLNQLVDWALDSVQLRSFA